MYIFAMFICKCNSIKNDILKFSKITNEMTVKQFDFIKTMCCDIEELFPTLPSDTTLFIACQSALESNFGTSDLARLHNNYFGMRNVMSRPSTSLVRGNAQFEWSEYHNKFYSIIDYFLCLAYRQPLSKELENIGLFKLFIKRWYCPENSYIEKITKIFNQFKSLHNENKI